VSDYTKAAPFSGAVYVSRAKRADRLKLIYWDGTGLCLFAGIFESGPSAGRAWGMVWFGCRPCSIRLAEGLDRCRVHAIDTPTPIKAS
jgi:transposase